MPLEAQQVARQLALQERARVTAADRDGGQRWKQGPSCVRHCRHRIAVQLAEVAANDLGQRDGDLAEWLAMHDPAPAPPTESATSAPDPSAQDTARLQREVGGPAGPEPTRYGDWEKAGRCIDF